MAVKHIYICVFIFMICCLVLFSGCSVISPRKENRDALREKLVKTALRYKGSPYRYGGATPKGFDCGGFTSFVYKKSGITIPRSSGDQYKQGDSISISELQQGDLVFFTRWGAVGKLFPPNHVGIFIGNDRFIHAPSSGGKVRIDRLGDNYWDTHYKGSRNFIE